MSSRDAIKSVLYVFFAFSIGFVALWICGYTQGDHSLFNSNVSYLQSSLMNQLAFTEALWRGPYLWALIKTLISHTFLGAITFGILSYTCYDLSTRSQQIIVFIVTLLIILLEWSFIRTMWLFQGSEFWISFKPVFHLLAVSFISNIVFGVLCLFKYEFIEL